jgi:hypothetical protein
MGHLGFPVIQPFGLGQGKVGGEEVFHLVGIQIKVTGITGRGLPNVTAEPHGVLVFQLSNGKTLEFLDGKVQVTDDVPADDVAEEFDGKALQIGLIAGRRVDDGDIISEVELNVLLVELFGSDVADADKLLFFVPGFEGEGLRGLPKEMTNIR